MPEGDAPSDLALALSGLVGTTLGGKYAIERLVAEGGFGVVFRAVHDTLGHPLAVKVLKTPPDFGEKARAAFIEAFAREARTMARLRHPAIVQIVDFGVSPMPQGEP